MNIAILNALLLIYILHSFFSDTFSVIYMLRCPAAAMCTSVQQARVCRRYLSPTRCQTTSLSRPSSSVSRRLPLPKQVVSASLRTSFMNWSQLGSKYPSFDIMSHVHRITAVLHLDLPQAIQEKYSSLKQQQPDIPKLSVKKSDKTHAIHLRVEEDIAAKYISKDVAMKNMMKDNTAVELVTTNNSKLTKDDTQEQHDLEQAIFQTNATISDFHKSKSTNSKSGVSKPFTKPPDQIRKEMQQPLLQQIASFLPRGGGVTKPSSKDVEAKMKRVMVAKRSIDSKTRGLVEGLRTAKSNLSRLTRLDELCKHLRTYPESKNLAVRVSDMNTYLNHY